MKNTTDLYFKNPSQRYQSEYQLTLNVPKQQPSSIPRNQAFVKNSVSFGQVRDSQFLQKKQPQTQYLKPYQIKIPIQSSRNQLFYSKVDYNVPREQNLKLPTNQTSLAYTKANIKSSIDLNQYGYINYDGNKEAIKKKNSKSQEQIQSLKNEIKILKKDGEQKMIIINEMKNKLSNFEYALRNKDNQIRKQRQRIQSQSYNNYNQIINQNQRLRKQMKMMLSREKKLIDQKNEYLKKGQEKYRGNIEKNQLKLMYEKKIEQMSRFYLSEKENMQKNISLQNNVIENIKKQKIEYEKKIMIQQKRIEELDNNRRQLQQNFTQSLQKKQNQILNLRQQIQINKKNLQKEAFNSQIQNNQKIKQLQLQIKTIQNQYYQLQNQFKKQQTKNIHFQHKFKSLQIQYQKQRQQKQKNILQINKQKQHYQNQKQYFNKKFKEYQQKIEKLQINILKTTNQLSQLQKNQIKDPPIKKIRLNHHQHQQLSRQKQKLLEQIKKLIQKKQQLNVDTVKITNKNGMTEPDVIHLKNQITKKSDLINNLCANIKNMQIQINKHHQNSRNVRLTQQLLRQANDKIIANTLSALNIKFAQKIKNI